MTLAQHVDGSVRRGDLADQAVFTQEQDVVLAIAQVKRNAQKGNDPVLAQKRAEGLAGIDCAKCGEEIGKARLKALPGAIRCITCEEERETSHS